MGLAWMQQVQQGKRPAGDLHNEEKGDADAEGRFFAHGGGCFAADWICGETCFLLWGVGSGLMIRCSRAGVGSQDGLCVLPVFLVGS